MLCYIKQYRVSQQHCIVRQEQKWTVLRAYLLEWQLLVTAHRYGWMQAGTPHASLLHPAVHLHQALLAQQPCQVLLLFQKHSAPLPVYLSPSDAQGRGVRQVGRQQVQNQAAWALTAGTASCVHVTDLMWLLQCVAQRWLLLEK